MTLDGFAILVDLVTVCPPKAWFPSCVELVAGGGMSWLPVLTQRWAGSYSVPHFHPSLTASLPEPSHLSTPRACNQPSNPPRQAGNMPPSEMILFPSPS